MRIAIAHESIDTDGGVETYLLSVIAELRARGHELALVHHRPSTVRTLLRQSAHVTIGLQDRGVEQALSELAAWRPDVCYSHNMGPLDVERALMRKWPVVKMLHGFFGTCVSGLKMHAFPSPTACHRTFSVACLALYVPRRCGQLSPSAMIGGYRWASDQHALLPKYKAVVVASRFMGGEVARHGVASAAIQVLPLFSTMTGHPPVGDAESDTVLFAGRMTSLKGGHVLVEAASRAARMRKRPVRLLMAGDGPQRAEWQTLAASRGVPAEFTGWVGNDDRARVYGRAMAVAVPSLWPEPFGLIGLDAASLGRPAVAFDVGGIGEWLQDGRNGSLVPPAEGEHGLARAIASLLDATHERERMGREALNVARTMTVGAHVTKLEAVLRAAAGH
jgi:glycosyltransferase involved in cell wall biosynthesis